MTAAAQPAPIRGLTVHQPWAWLIAAGHKPIENRGWPPPPSIVGGYLAIHAGKKVDRGEWGDILDEVMLAHAVTQDHLESQCGAIIAVARVTGSVVASDSPWFIGPIGWILSDVVAIDPVPCRGMQGLWSLPPDVLTRVRGNYAAARASVPDNPDGLPETQCPRCGAWEVDHDGFGVLAHFGPGYRKPCGYCSHPSRDGRVCNICGVPEIASGASP